MWSKTAKRVEVEAHHMDLSFSRSQSRFKDGQMIYTSQALEIHP